MSTTIEDLFDSIEEVASEAVEAQQLLYTVEDELLKLKMENKKLRELVRDMWDVALHPETFGDGSYLLRRMRDLGIEAE